MRISKYGVELENKGRLPVLVKESSTNYGGTTLQNPEEIVEMMNYVFHADAKAEEHLWVLALNNKCHPIGIFEISHGTINASLVTPREIFVRLCLCGAVGFVVIHNHPSGDIAPSKEDFSITKRLKEVGDLMQIPLYDHIIIGNNMYYSMKSMDQI